MKYKMIPNNDKNNWTMMIASFTNLYDMWKGCSEYRDTLNIFDSAANVTHIAPSASIGNVSINVNRCGTVGNIIPMQEDYVMEA